MCVCVCAFINRIFHWKLFELILKLGIALSLILCTLGQNDWVFFVSHGHDNNTTDYYMSLFEYVQEVKVRRRRFIEEWDMYATQRITSHHITSKWELRRVFLRQSLSKRFQSFLVNRDWQSLITVVGFGFILIFRISFYRIDDYHVKEFIAWNFTLNRHTTVVAVGLLFIVFSLWLKTRVRALA